MLCVYLMCVGVCVVRGVVYGVCGGCRGCVGYVSFVGMGVYFVCGFGCYHMRVGVYLCCMCVGCVC